MVAGVCTEGAAVFAVPAARSGVFLATKDEMHRIVSLVEPPGRYLLGT